MTPDARSGPIQTLVYPSIAHAEFGRLLQKFGFDAEPVADDGRIGYRILGIPRYVAWMQTPFPERPGEFAAIFLLVGFSLPVNVSAEVVRALRWQTMLAHLDVNRSGGVSATHTLIVCGGITEYYLRDQLWHWSRDLERICEEVRRQRQLAAGRTVH